ncbi:transporter substrate-binding protein [Mesorhizobium sp. M1163]|uniref:transporter substrate-binding protein n=1 Tax=Mesorhizobium sp. M1163 TaxID=2957065 RepID=UPI00333914A4
MKRHIEIGILYSRSGNYRLVSESCRAGAMNAIADVNADPVVPFEFIPVERDPQGNIDRYASGCADILANSGARHIIGCVTSWSRKEVIPILERAGGTLWYACPYEGSMSMSSTPTPAPISIWYRYLPMSCLVSAPTASCSVPTTSGVGRPTVWRAT